MAISIRLSRRFSGNAPDRSNRVGFRRSVCGWLVVSFLVGGVNLLYARGADEEFARARYDLLQELNTDRLEYQVVPGAVVAPDIPESQRSVLGAYVRIVRDIVIDLPRRYLDEEERTAIAVSELRRRRGAVSRQIDERKREIDRERMARETGPDASVPERDGDTRLRALYDQRDVLDSIAAEDIEVPEEAHLSVPAEDEYELRWTLSTAEPTSRAAEADLFLYLTVDPLDELYVVTVRLAVPVLDSDREVLRIIAAPDTIPLQLERYSREIVHEVANRPVSDLFISASDADGNAVEEARLYLDDELVGIGSGRNPYVPAGTYELRGVTPDGRTERRTVAVGEGEQLRVALLFPEEAPREITITSNPRGASVYRGVVWQGFTPVQVPRPPQPTPYTLSRDEYYDSRVEIGPDSPDIVERVLISREYDWETETKISRDRFYRSFGWFALSVGVPIILYGTYQDYAGLYPGGVARGDISAAEQQRLQREVNTVFYGYYGSIALSGGLFANMIWRLVQYVQTAQGYHTR
jgi:hypothetical protein